MNLLGAIHMHAGAMGGPDRSLKSRTPKAMIRRKGEVFHERGKLFSEKGKLFPERGEVFDRKGEVFFCLKGGKFFS